MRFEVWKWQAPDLREWLADPLQVEKDDLKAYLQAIRDRGLKTSSQRKVFTCISAFYAFVVDEDLLESNPILPFTRRYLRQYKEELKKKHAEHVGLLNPDSKKHADRFTPHCCRHWLVTHLLRAGMSRDHVKWIRGDTMKESIDIYYHIDAEDVRKSYMAYVPQLGI